MKVGTVIIHVIITVLMHRHNTISRRVQWIIFIDFVAVFAQFRPFYDLFYIMYEQISKRPDNIHSRVHFGDSRLQTLNPHMCNIKQYIYKE